MVQLRARLFRSFGVTVGGLMLAAALAGSVSAQEADDTAKAFDIEVSASIVESGVPATVATTSVTTNAEGQPSHGVQVTWNGTSAVTLDDARFTHHVIDGEGDLVTAGRGCGADWNADSSEVSHICTADLQLVDLAPGETHEYPVRIYPEVGPLALEPGTYVVDQTIGWEPSNGGARQEFTLRLTYTVEEAAETGTLTPAPAPSGVTISSWSGGPAEQLPDAESYWVTVDGDYVSYVPDAPAFVNARFLTLYADGIPAGTLMLVVR